MSATWQAFHALEPPQAEQNRVIWLALVERLEHVEVVQTFLSFGNLRILSASLGASLGIVYHNDWRVALAGWLTGLAHC